MDVKTSEFKEFISKGKVVIDFWASWCGPCRALGPIIEDVCKRNNVKLGKVNVDNETLLAEAYRIQAIPYVVKFIDGEVVDYFLGFKTEEEIEKFIK